MERLCDASSSSKYEDHVKIARRRGRLGGGRLDAVAAEIGGACKIALTATISRGLLLLVVVGGGGWWWLRGRGISAGGGGWGGGDAEGQGSYRRG